VYYKDTVEKQHKKTSRESKFYVSWKYIKCNFC